MRIDDAIIAMKSKYNYNKSQIKFFKTIMNNMIAYFGEEFSDKIIKTFLEVPILFINDKEDIQNKAKALGVKEEYKIPLFASAVYEEYYQKDDSSNIERIPFIMIKNYHNKDDFNVYISTVIHEMCHAVMNKDKQIINGDRVFSKTGMIENVITFDNDRKKTVSSYVAIEEGMNEYDARIITEMILGEKSNSTSYGMLVDYVSPVMNNEYLRKIIDTSRMNGDNEWKKVFGENLANEFVDTLMNYYNFLFDRTIPRDQKQILKEEYMKKNRQVYKKMIEFSQSYNDYLTGHSR